MFVNQFKINKIVPPNVGSMGDYLKQLQATGQFPDVMMSNFAVAEFIEAGLLLPFEDEDLVRFADPVGLGLTNGRQYALPMLTVVESLIFYNKNMFEEAGISEGLIRLSIGIESVDDLIEDLEKGFRSAAKALKR